MKTREQSKRFLLLGIAGCLLYVIGDFLFAATGKGQTTETVGFMVRTVYLEMGTWRMAANILCGFVGSLPVTNRRRASYDQNHPQNRRHDVFDV